MNSGAARKWHVSSSPNGHVCAFGAVEDAVKVGGNVATSPLLFAFLKGPSGQPPSVLEKD